MSLRRVGSVARALRVPGPTSRIAAAAALLLTGGGCATNALKLAPASPTQPWEPGQSRESLLIPGDVEAPPDAAAGASGFSVPRNPDAAVLRRAPSVRPGHVYRLPELIDIAQRNDTVTRIAWEQARQAALAAGMVESTFLPAISANVIGGYQTSSAPVSLPLGGDLDLTSSASGVVPSVALEWLVFDFGQREAALDAARETALAANVQFNGAHQQLIYDVARTYYEYGAARTSARIARRAEQNSRVLREAANERMESGVGTTVEVMQARQQVAEAKLRRVQAQGTERDAYQALLAAMGVPPTTEIEVGDASGRRLPRAVNLPVEEMIRLALSRRPDVLASYAAVNAARAGVNEAEADFLPKVYLAGVAASDEATFETGDLPTIDQQASASGIFVGVTVPLYDSGLRDARVKSAKSRVAAAKQVFAKTQDEAAREVVVAADTLRTALESYHAAVSLVEAAATTFDAALDAYRNGVGTMTAVAVADDELLDARQARADAHAASLVAGTNLAFVLGAMTSPDVPAAVLGPGGFNRRVSGAAGQGRGSERWESDVRLAPPASR